MGNLHDLILAALLASLLLSGACSRNTASVEKKAAPVKEEEGPPVTPPREGGKFYDEKFQYRIEYPKGIWVVVHSADRDVGDGDEFESQDNHLKGSVSGFLLPEDRRVDQAVSCKNRIAEEAEPFVLAFQAAKGNICAYSGTRGEKVIYRKTYVTPVSEKSLAVEYPASEKARFDPAVANLANSFEEYIECTATVWIVETHLEAGGRLITTDQEGERIPGVDNLKCDYEAADAGKFEALKPKQRVRVGGRPVIEPVPAGVPVEGDYNLNLKKCMLLEVLPLKASE